MEFTKNIIEKFISTINQKIDEIKSNTTNIKFKSIINDFFIYVDNKKFNKKYSMALHDNLTQVIKHLTEKKKVDLSTFLFNKRIYKCNDKQYLIVDPYYNNDYYLISLDKNNEHTCKYIGNDFFRIFCSPDTIYLLKNDEHKYTKINLNDFTEHVIEIEDSVTVHNILYISDKYLITENANKRKDNIIDGSTEKNKYNLVKFDNKQITLDFYNYQHNYIWSIDIMYLIIIDSHIIYIDYESNVKIFIQNNNYKMEFLFNNDNVKNNIQLKYGWYRNYFDNSLVYIGANRLIFYIHNYEYSIDANTKINIKQLKGYKESLKKINVTSDNLPKLQLTHIQDNQKALNRFKHLIELRKLLIEKKNPTKQTKENKTFINLNFLQKPEDKEKDYRTYLSVDLFTDTVDEKLKTFICTGNETLNEIILKINKIINQEIEYIEAKIQQSKIISTDTIIKTPYFKIAFLNYFLHTYSEIELHHLFLDIEQSDVEKIKPIVFYNHLSSYDVIKRKVNESIPFFLNQKSVIRFHTNFFFDYNTKQIKEIKTYKNLNYYIYLGIIGFIIFHIILNIIQKIFTIYLFNSIHIVNRKYYDKINVRHENDLINISQNDTVYIEQNILLYNKNIWEKIMKYKRIRIVAYNYIHPNLFECIYSHYKLFYFIPIFKTIKDICLFYIIQKGFSFVFNVSKLHLQDILTISTLANTTFKNTYFENNFLTYLLTETFEINTIFPITKKIHEWNENILQYDLSWDNFIKLKGIEGKAITTIINLFIQIFHIDQGRGIQEDIRYFLKSNIFSVLHLKTFIQNILIFLLNIALLNFMFNPTINIIFVLNPIKLLSHEILRYIFLFLGTSIIKNLIKKSIIKLREKKKNFTNKIITKSAAKLVKKSNNKKMNNDKPPEIYLLELIQYYIITYIPYYFILKKIYNSHDNLKKNVMTDIQKITCFDIDKKAYNEKIQKKIIFKQFKTNKCSFYDPDRILEFMKINEIKRNNKIQDENQIIFTTYKNYIYFKKNPINKKLNFDIYYYMQDIRKINIDNNNIFIFINFFELKEFMDLLIYLNDFEKSKKLYFILDSTSRINSVKRMLSLSNFKNNSSMYPKKYYLKLFLLFILSIQRQEVYYFINLIKNMTNRISKEIPVAAEVTYVANVYTDQNKTEVLSQVYTPSAPPLAKVIDDLVDVTPSAPQERVL